MLLNLLSTSGLLKLLHDVISLSDASHAIYNIYSNVCS